MRRGAQRGVAFLFLVPLTFSLGFGFLYGYFNPQAVQGDLASFMGMAVVIDLVSLVVPCALAAVLAILGTERTRTPSPRGVSVDGWGGEDEPPFVEKAEAAPPVSSTAYRSGLPSPAPAPKRRPVPETVPVAPAREKAPGPVPPRQQPARGHGNLLLGAAGAVALASLCSCGGGALLGVLWYRNDQAPAERRRVEEIQHQAREREARLGQEWSVRLRDAEQKAELVAARARKDVEETARERDKLRKEKDAAEVKARREKDAAEDKARREKDAAEAKARLAARDAASQSYAALLTQARNEWSVRNVRRAQALLAQCPAEERGWEWHYLKRLAGGSTHTLHPRNAQRLGFSLDGRILYGHDSVNRRLHFWNTHTGNAMAGPASSEPILTFAPSPVGNHLAVFRWNKVLLLDRAEKVIAEFTPLGPLDRLALSPDGKRLAAGGRAAENDKTSWLCVWDVAERRELYRGKAPPQALGDLAFSPDGQRLAYAGQTADGGPAEIGVRDLTKGEDLLSVAGSKGQVAFNPTGNQIAVPGVDRAYRLWDLGTGKEVPTPPGQSSCLAFLPGGKLLATGGTDRAVRLWDPTTGRTVQTFWGHTGEVRTLAVSPDGAMLASASEPTGFSTTEVKLWKLREDFRSVTVQMPGLPIRRLAADPAGQRLVLGLQDGTVALWEVGIPGTYTPLGKHPSSVGAVAYRPGGKQAASASLAPAGSPAGELILWDLAERRVQHRLGLPGLRDVRLSYSADGSRLACAVSRQPGRKTIDEVVLVDTATGQAERTINVPLGRILATRFSTPKDELAVVRALNETRAETLQSRRTDGTVRLWSRIQTARAGDTTDVLNGGVLAPDAQRVATSTFTGGVVLWNVQGHRVWAVPLPPDRVTGLTFSPDGKRVVTFGPGEHGVRFWSAQRGVDLYCLPTPQVSVSDVTFSADGRRLFAGGVDPAGTGGLLIWESVAQP